jgi:hypothetical protein
MTASIHPRLIRPSRDGEEGGWSYLFSANGHDYIFPALVNELGGLKPLVNDIFVEPGAPSIEDTDPSWATKVIYWKASEWEEKLLPKAVEWINKNGFTIPPIPYRRMELRKIEDRGGDDRVSEVMNLTAFETKDGFSRTELIVYQFTEVGGEEGKGRKPLMQWWMEGFVEFKGADVAMRGYSVPQACDRLSDWADIPGFLKHYVNEKGPAEAFKVLGVQDNRDTIREEALRAAVMWIAFCRYITSLKTTYEEGLPRRGPKRAAARTTEEALALEQATIFKTVGVLKSGVQKRPVATGAGTRHRYRYLVRGHERIINGKSIWIKPQVRGEGEFLARSIGTEEAEVAAKEIEPPVEVKVLAEEARADEPAVSAETVDEVVEQVDQPATDAEVTPEPVAPTVPVAEPEPTPAIMEPPPVVPTPRVAKPRRSVLQSAVRFFLSLFRR